MEPVGMPMRACAVAPASESSSASSALSEEMVGSCPITRTTACSGATPRTSESSSEGPPE